MSAKKEIAELETYGTAVCRNGDDDINSLYPGALKIAFEKKRYSIGIESLREVGKQALQVGMVQLRLKRDLQLALAAFRSGTTVVLEWLPKYLDAMELVRADAASPPEGSSFSPFVLFFPLHCALFADDWPSVSSLAGAMVSPLADKDLDQDMVQKALIFGALVRNDKDALNQVSRLKDADLEKAGMLSYVRCVRAIDSGDEKSFNSLLNEMEEQFLARAKIKRDPNLVYGTGKIDNQLSFDFQAVGLAKIAAHRGMNVEKDSDVIPKTLVNFCAS